MQLRAIPVTVLAVAAIVVGSTPAASAEQQSDAHDLLDLSVEQLLNTEVTTASRRAQAAGLVPAPLYVITQADIKRSAARSIPELLRAVPGLQVAQVDANKWAVGARGINRRFSNKLLILMDGRPVYSPLFSGVFWDIQDTDLDSIERIEVVSGPGATLWGPNAVNGVINVITRRASDTSGRAVHASLDGHGSSSLQARVAGELGDSAAGRVFVKRSEFNGNENVLGMRADDAAYTRVGTRLDGERGNSRWMLSAEGYDGKSGSMTTLALTSPPFVNLRAVNDTVSGGFLNSHWNHTDGAGRETSLSASFERSIRDSYFFDEVRNTWQVDMQRSQQAALGRNVMWGLSYRHSQDRIDGEPPISIRVPRDTVTVAGGFVQGEFNLVPERLDLVAGAKLEYESLSDETHFEPNLRLRYRVDDRSMLWASAARAVGMPSRGERDAEIVGPFIAPNTARNPSPLPIIATVSSSGDIQAELGDTFELGHRWHSDRQQVRIESSLYYTKYRRLMRAQAGLPLCQPAGTPAGPLGCPPGTGFLMAPSFLQPDGKADSYGLELFGEWWPRERLRLTGAYTFQRVSNDNASKSLELAVTSPEHQAYLRASLDLLRAVSADVNVRYVDVNVFADIPSYVAVDARLAWAPRVAMEFALVGRNLFDPGHIEYVSEIGDLVPTPIERTVQFELRYRF